MKIGKKMISLVVLVGVFFVSCPVPAQAEPKWYSCKVRLIGIVEDDSIQIQLNDKNGAFKKTIVNPALGQEDRVMALAMAAKINGIPLMVYMDIDTKPIEIERVFLGP